jgi:endo-1,4-beta-xylanase
MTVESQTTRRAFNKTIALSVLGTLLPMSASSSASSSAPLTTLKDSARQKGLMFGSAVNRKMFQFPEYVDIIKKECDVVVAENEFKWRFIQPKPDSERYHHSDRIAHFSNRFGLKLRGHTFHFHSAVPNWIKQLDEREALERLETFVRSVGTRYAGRVCSWDVLNEVASPATESDAFLREDFFLTRYGKELLVDLLHWARSAAPAAELVYNEWCLPYDSSYFGQREERILRFCEYCLRSGAPLQGIGIQSHLRADRTDWNEKRWRRFLKDLADLGLTIHITELDISDPWTSLSVDQRDAKLADYVRRYLDITLDEPAVRTVMTWGLSDRFSAVSLYFPRSDAELPRSLPFDEEFQPKKMYLAIQRALNGTKERGRHPYLEF